MPRKRKRGSPADRMSDLVDRTRGVVDNLEAGLKSLEGMEAEDPELAAANRALEAQLKAKQASKRAAQVSTAARGAAQPSAAISATDGSRSAQDSPSVHEIVPDVNYHLDQEDKARKGPLKGGRNANRHIMKQNFSQQARDLTGQLNRGESVSKADIEALKNLRDRINRMENANQREGEKK